MKDTKRVGRKRQKSGSARMRAKGMHPILLWVTEEELETIRATAKRKRQSMNQYMVGLAIPEK